MLNAVAILALLGTFLLPGASAAQHQEAKPDTEQTEADGRGREVPPAPSGAAHQTYTQTNPTQTDPTERPLPRFMRPEWIVVYITAI